MWNQKKPSGDRFPEENSLELPVRLSEREAAGDHNRNSKAIDHQTSGVVDHTLPFNYGDQAAGKTCALRRGTGGNGRSSAPIRH